MIRNVEYVVGATEHALVTSGSFKHSTQWLAGGGMAPHGAGMLSLAIPNDHFNDHLRAHGSVVGSVPVCFMGGAGCMGQHGTAMSAAKHNNKVSHSLMPSNMERQQDTSESINMPSTHEIQTNNNNNNRDTTGKCLRHSSLETTHNNAQQ